MSLSFNEIIQNGFDSDCDKDVDDDIFLNDIVGDECAEVPIENCGLFTSVHADEENANVDIDFISEQLVDETRVKRSICISDTGIPNDWDDKIGKMVILCRSPSATNERKCWTECGSSS